MLRRLLHPLGEAARQLTEVAAERSPLAPVSVRRNDEIGQLLSAFNHLIQVLGERETLLKQVLNATHVGICLMDFRGTISLANRAMSEMFGIPASRFSGLQYFALVPPEERERVRKTYFPIDPENPLALDFDRVFLREDGSRFWGHLTVRRLHDPQGAGRGVIAVIADIDERKKVEQALRHSKQQYDSMALQIPIGIYILRNSAANVFTADYISPRTAALFGLPVDCLRENPAAVYDVIHPNDRAVFIRIHDEARANQLPIEWEGRVLRDGLEHWLHVASEPETLENGDVLWHGMVEDITERQAHERQLEVAAHYDALTGLPNRVLLADRMRQAMALTQRRGTKLAVAFIDLDGFKEVNDEFGHAAGDRVLIALAGHMRKVLRESDTLARIGGDEFVATILDLENESAAWELVGRILNAVAEPLTVKGVMLQVRCSIGVAFYPQGEEVDADQLLRQADQAMYHAKVAGKNRFHAFDADEQRDLRGMHALFAEVQRAVDHDEFVLHYQPKVNMKSGRVVGAEALIRWQHPERGLCSPMEFLPMIEDHPVSVAVGEWVIANALSQMAAWRAEGLGVPVSVNIGALQLQQDDFISRLQALLASVPTVSPNDLMLEVVETSALADIGHVSAVILAARQLGVEFSLDDFGTGYSSLTYLKRLAAREIKIDQSFVRDMLDDSEDLSILEGVIGLARAFGRDVVAEGVESTAHGNMLLLMGCELAQGYGIGRPMPAQDFIAWTKSWEPPCQWRELSPARWQERAALFAMTEHRAWVARVQRYVRGLTEDVPAMGVQNCRFGLWLDIEGKGCVRDDAVFQRVLSLHEEIHCLAAAMCVDVAQGRREVAAARLPELMSLRDALLAALSDIFLRGMWQ